MDSALGVSNSGASAGVVCCGVGRFETASLASSATVVEGTSSRGLEIALAVDAAALIAALSALKGGEADRRRFHIESVAIALSEADE